MIYWINLWLVRGDTDIISTSWSAGVALVARLALGVEVVVKIIIMMQLMMLSHTTHDKMNLLCIVMLYVKILISLSANTLEWHLQILHVFGPTFIPDCSTAPNQQGNHILCSSSSISNWFLGLLCTQDLRQSELMAGRFMLATIPAGGSD